MKNCVLYLVRTSPEDLASLNESLRLLENNVLSAMKEKPDLLLFHENSFNAEYKSNVRHVKNVNTIFQEVEFSLPSDYGYSIKNRILKFFPHPTHGKDGPHGDQYFKEHKCFHPGFSMGYRHMCNFFSGKMYENIILQNYEYYLRLDTDSFIHSQIRYDLFEWAKTTNCEYGFIEPAVQKDNPKVISGLWATTENYIKEYKLQTKNKFDSLPEGTMYYTNFELGKISSFSPGSQYYDFYQMISDSGGIFTDRWGDAPIKYLGVNLFIDSLAIKPVSGFVYQHGAIYHT